MENIVLFGGGFHAQCCVDIIEKENKYNIIGITDTYKDVGSEFYGGYKVIGRQEQLQELIKNRNYPGMKNTS